MVVTTSCDIVANYIELIRTTVTSCDIGRHYQLLIETVDTLVSHVGSAITY